MKNGTAGAILDKKIAKEKRKLAVTVVFLCASIVFTGYIFATGEVPFYGSISEREYEALEEKYADYFAQQYAAQEAAEEDAEKTFVYRSICGAFESQEIDVEALLTEEQTVKTAYDYGSLTISEGVDIDAFASEVDEGNVPVFMDGETVEDPSALNWHDMFAYEIAVSADESGQYRIDLTELQ